MMNDRTMRASPEAFSDLMGFFLWPWLGPHLLLDVKPFTGLSQFRTLQVSNLKHLFTGGRDVRQPRHVLHVAISAYDLGGRQRNTKTEVSHDEALKFTCVLTLCCSRSNRPRNLPTAYARCSLVEANELAAKFVKPNR